MAIMFYDSIVSGHHSEYINHLIDFLTSKNHKEENENYYFVVSKSFKDNFGEIVDKTLSNHRVEWVFLEDEELATFNNLPRWRRCFVEFAVVQEYATKLHVQDVFLLYLDTFEIALMFLRPNFSVSGILFIQLFRLKRNTWKEKFRYYKKSFYTYLFVANTKLKTVFILNDTLGSNHLNKSFGTTKFKPLVDPIPRFSSASDFDVYSYYSIDRNKKILLHPGSINSRKGTYEILDSVYLWPDNLKDEFVILIVGKANQEVDTQLKEKIKQLEDSANLVVYDNTFIADDKLEVLFKEAYAVLIPYKNVESSSGILGHAAKVGKPVLAPSAGLLGNMVQDFKLGVTIDKITPAEISNGILKLLNFDDSSSLAREFTESRTPEAFGKEIFSIFT